MLLFTTKGEQKGLNEGKIDSSLLTHFSSASNVYSDVTQSLLKLN